MVEWTVIFRDEKDKVKSVVFEADEARYAKGLDLTLWRDHQIISTFKEKDLVGYFQGRDANFDLKIEGIEPKE